MSPETPEDVLPEEVDAAEAAAEAEPADAVDPALEDTLPEDEVAEDPDAEQTEQELTHADADSEGEPDYLADLLRVQADFENYKKRMLRQQTEHLERANESLVTKLLPVLDAGDLALSHGSEEVGAVVGMLRDVLAKDGLEVIAPESGGAFDPNVHDAVAHEEGDGEPQIAEVLRAGYLWKGRLIRPAMVRVKG